MNQHDARNSPPPATTPSRRARLEALLFAGASLGATLLTLGATTDPKLPPFKGE